MMGKIRKRTLPAGWYPADRRAALEIVKTWSGSVEKTAGDGVACVVPHAGWDFSGELAFSTLAALKTPVDTVAVVGGHLPPVSRLLSCRADQFETPFGFLESDQEMLTALWDEMEVEDDRHADNTVEIQLPLINHLFPGAKVLYLRVSPTPDAILLGGKLHELSQRFGRSLVVVGSTDLTHYGPAYGFMPAGSGESAIEWVRGENDSGLLDLILKMDAEGAMDHAKKHGSACSAGAAAAAVAFSVKCGITAGRLVGYRMSCDTHKAESFVGYGGIVFGLP
jgi:AmmeMemoRadiSam system protein B